MVSAASAQPPREDHLAFERGVHAYLATAPLVALLAVRTGLRRYGPDNETEVELNTTRGPQALAWLNLKAGPIVVEVPVDAVAVIHDFWARPISGRAFGTRSGTEPLLALPPDFRGDAPKGYRTIRSRTFGNRLLIARGESGAGAQERLRIYPLADAVRPAATNHVRAEGRLPALQPAMGLTHFNDVDRVIQEELVEAPDRDTTAILASIGIRKGSEFAPDDRLQKILTVSAAVGGEAEYGIRMGPAQ